MNLLNLSGILLIVAECLRSEETNKKRVVIHVGGDQEAAIYDAVLPIGYDKGEAEITGYLVELDDPSGCKANLTLKGLKENEDPSDANLIPYVEWPGSSDCSFTEMINNLRDITPRTVKINSFVLIASSSEQYGKVDKMIYVLLMSQDVSKFKASATQDGHLTPIEIKIQREQDPNSTIPMSSMAILFVTVAFVTLMTVSIGWLVFYYAQRCRQRNMRERMQSRLCVAAKRAVSKLPTKTVPDLPKTTKKMKKTAPSPCHDNDSTCSSCSSNEDADFCPVCLDLYKPREVIRILPCKHEFHKMCVDPWLFDHRTCPMCKLDILEHLGMPSGGDRLDSPVVTVQSPPTVEPSENNVSTRVDQEVQTDFVNPPSPHQRLTSVAVRVSRDDEIEPAPISPPAV